MASFEKLPSGKWRAQVKVGTVRSSASFRTKAEAQQWAAAEEAAIHAGNAGKFPDRTLSEAIDRYTRDVSPGKLAGRQEAYRLRMLQRDFPALAAKPLHAITAADMAAWRDEKLKKVTAGTVARDMNTLSHLWTLAREEWLWCGESPLRKIRPKGADIPRTRLMGWREIRLTLRWLGFTTGKPPKTKTQAVAWALLVALRTGMRAGEVLQLSAETVNLAAGVAKVKDKTRRVRGDDGRKVPLTPRAVALLRIVLPTQWLGMKSAHLDALWRKNRDRLGLPDVRFHDSRATALTHLARKVDPMTLARISGHADLALLLRTYYRETPEAIARRLAQPTRGPQRGTIAGIEH